MPCDVDSAVKKSFRRKTPLSTYIASIFRIAISMRHTDASERDFLPFGKPPR